MTPEDGNGDGVATGVREDERREFHRKQERLAEIDADLQDAAFAASGVPAAMEDAGTFSDLETQSVKSALQTLRAARSRAVDVGDELAADLSDREHERRRAARDEETDR